MRNISEIGSDFEHGAQEDAHEFLRKFVDALQNCCGLQPPGVGPLHKPYPFALFAGVLMVSSYDTATRIPFFALTYKMNCLLTFACPFHFQYLDPHKVHGVQECILLGESHRRSDVGDRWCQ